MCCTAVYGRGKKPKQSHSSLDHYGRPDCGGDLLVQEVVFANGNGREGMCFCKPERGHWDQFRYACRGCFSPLRCSIQRRSRTCAIIQSNILRRSSEPRSVSWTSAFARGKSKTS